MKKDNSTSSSKIKFRRLALELQPSPVVLETHGGYGRMYSACYGQISQGVVFESDDRKAGALAQQRPTWAVYQADSEMALRSGAGAHLPVNLVDIDPYGDPWPFIDAFLESKRPKVDTLCIVVNDGLRQTIQMGGAWHVGTLKAIVLEWGNALYDRYLEVCRELMKQKAAANGYHLQRFWGRYVNPRMTHYLALLARSS